MKGFLLALPVLFSLAAAPAPLSDSRAEPALPTGRDIQDRPYPMLAYVRVFGGPFTAPLRWDQIAQGELGSCFFLSTLAAIAHDRPLAVSGAIRGDGHGAFVVTLQGADGRARVIAVDDRFPATSSGKTFFARGLDPREIRPALFEKAYAKLLGGYSAIDGGDATAAFLALTGVVGTDHSVAGLTEEKIWRLLTSARGERRPAVASTFEFAELKRRTGRDDLDGMIDDHVYAVVGLREEGGRRYVRLYTPLSPGDAGYDPSGPRLSEISLQKFRSYFDAVTVQSRLVPEHGR